MTAEQAKKLMHDHLQSGDLTLSGPQQKKYQALYDKYFGSGGGPKPFDALDIATTLSAAYGSDPEYFNLGGVKHKDMNPAQAKEALLYTLKNTADAKTKQVAQGLYDKYFGSGAPQAQPSAPSTALPSTQAVIDHLVTMKMPNQYGSGWHWDGPESGTPRED